MSKRFILEAESGEWSEWQWSGTNKQRIGCCDCGLVHDFEFKPVTINGKAFHHVTKGQVLWRVRGNDKATKRLRKQRA